MSCEWHSEAFEAGMKWVASTTSRKLTEVLNQTGMNVAGRALNNTKMADKAKIQRTLGEVSRDFKIVQNKTGKNKGKSRIVRGQRNYAQSNTKAGGPRAALLINASRRKQGLPGLEGQAMEMAIRRLVGAKLASVGFKKIGYIPAIKAFAGQLTAPFKIANVAGISIKPAPKGTGTPAKGDWKKEITLTNSVRDIQTPDDEEALHDALDQEGGEMERHVAEKLNEVTAEFNK